MYYAGTFCTVQLITYSTLLIFCIISAIYNALCAVALSIRYNRRHTICVLSVINAMHDYLDTWRTIPVLWYMLSLNFWRSGLVLAKQIKGNLDSFVLLVISKWKAVGSNSLTHLNAWYTIIRECFSVQWHVGIQRLHWDYKWLETSYENSLHLLQNLERES